MEIIIFSLLISWYGHIYQKIINNLLLLKDIKILIFKVIFQCWKSVESFWDFFFEEHQTRRQLSFKWNFVFKKTLLSKCLIFDGSVHIFGKSYIVPLNAYLCGLIPNAHKKSWMVSIALICLAFWPQASLLRS